MKYKCCPRCKQEKQVTDFYTNSFQKNGLATYCKRCDSELHRETYRRNGEKIRARMKITGKLRRERIRKEVLSYYSKGEPVCARCGQTDIRCLSLDHIAGGGNKHREELQGRGRGFSVYEWARQHRFPGGFQTLCMNCQFIKRVENKEN